MKVKNNFLNIGDAIKYIVRYDLSPTYLAACLYVINQRHSLWFPVDIIVPDDINRTGRAEDWQEVLAATIPYFDQRRRILLPLAESPLVISNRLINVDEKNEVFLMPDNEGIAPPYCGLRMDEAGLLIRFKPEAPSDLAFGVTAALSKNELRRAAQAYDFIRKEGRRYSYDLLMPDGKKFHFPLFVIVKFDRRKPQVTISLDRNIYAALIGRNRKKKAILNGSNQKRKPGRKPIRAREEDCDF